MARSPPSPPVTGTATPTIPNPTPSQVGSHVHFPGQYQLQHNGDLVTVILTTRAAALLAPSTLFTVPAVYLPPSLLWRDVVGRVVQADGTPHPAYPEPFPFRLWLHPDGTIRQALEAGPAGEERYLSYELAVTWGTTPAANDHAVLALLYERWVGTSVLSKMPSPSLCGTNRGANQKVSVPAHPYWENPGRQMRWVYTWMAFAWLN